MSWIGDRVSEWGKWWHVRMLYKKFAVCFKNAPISKHGGNGVGEATVVCLYNLFVPKNCLIYSYWFQRGLEIDLKVPPNIKLYIPNYQRNYLTCVRVLWPIYGFMKAYHLLKHFRLIETICKQLVIMETQYIWRSRVQLGLTSQYIEAKSLARKPKSFNMLYKK